MLCTPLHVSVWQKIWYLENEKSWCQFDNLQKDWNKIFENKFLRDGFSERAKDAKDKQLEVKSRRGPRPLVIFNLFANLVEDLR